MIKLSQRCRICRSYRKNFAFICIFIRDYYGDTLDGTVPWTGISFNCNQQEPNDRHVILLVLHFYISVLHREMKYFTDWNLGNLFCTCDLNGEGVLGKKLNTFWGNGMTD